MFYQYSGGVLRPIGGNSGGGGVVAPPPPAADFNDWAETGANTTFSQDASLYRTTTAGADQQAWAASADLGSEACRTQWANALIVPLSTTGATFKAKLQSTCDNAPGPCVVQLPAGVFQLNSFTLVGGSGDQSYSFGFFHPRLRGFKGAGAGKTYVGMAPNSMTQAQLDRLAGMASAAFSPNQMGMIRLDGHTTPTLNLGVTFASADQQMMSSTQVLAQNPVQPQPAPHQGVIFYGSEFQPGINFISHCEAEGAGKAWNSQPPFEHANFNTTRSNSEYYKVESDGRRSAVIDAARPRACGVIMGNNESRLVVTNWYQHHSPVSRWAVNDENADTQGIYTLINIKSEQMTNTQNDGKGGYTNVTSIGFESCNGNITIINPRIYQDNLFTDGQVPQIFQLTKVGDRDPNVVAGVTRFYVEGGVFRNAWPQLNDYACFRITPSHWSRDGYVSIITKATASSTRKTPYVYTGAWPPTAAQLTAAGLSPSTHCIVRTS